MWVTKETIESFFFSPFYLPHCDLIWFHWGLKKRAEWKERRFTLLISRATSKENVIWSDKIAREILPWANFIVMLLQHFDCMWGLNQMNCWRLSFPADWLVLCSCFAWMHTDWWTMGSVADPPPVILSLNRAASVSPCSVGRPEFILLVTLDEWKSKINPHTSWTHTYTSIYKGRNARTLADTYTHTHS